MSLMTHTNTSHGARARNAKNIVCGIAAHQKHTPISVDFLLRVPGGFDYHGPVASKRAARMVIALAACDIHVVGQLFKCNPNMFLTRNMEHLLPHSCQEILARIIYIMQTLVCAHARARCDD